MIRKAFLIKIIQDKEEYKYYFPNNIKFENIERDCFVNVNQNIM